MLRGNIKLDNEQRFLKEHIIPEQKLNAAIKAAADKLLSKLDIYAEKFPGTYSTDLVYPLGENNTWVSGMHTGTILLAYELTGDERFLECAKKHIPSYKKRLDEKIGLWSHDVGFVYSPSIVALYKLTGDEELRTLALGAAEHLYNASYSQKGGFVIRSSKNVDKDWGCRTMMDTLMNIPLFFWAYEQTGDKKYLDAANSQLRITESCLIREDGSSYHHYQFDVETHKPVCGVTFQGHRDESTWSRGQAWGVLGLPIAYTYNKDESLLPLHRDVTYFALNHLPDDCVPYWDYDFVDKCDEARDVSAGLASACGMLEACGYLPDSAPEKTIYKNAAAQILEAAIDMCADSDKTEFDGLVRYSTCSVPHGIGVEECTLYGDFFYLEAIIRYLRPDWKRYW
ncbi:MAG: glycoside hydrolase family 88 protein [Clostridia bacterium]|nr:glycoside hydrolase family 88 protein [Clostridia bacterium]